MSKDMPKETKPEEILELPAGNLNKYLPVIAGALILAAVAAGGTAYYYYSQFNELKADPQKIAQEENQELIDRIGKLILLPTDEQPTIATVADPEKLKDQAFFAKAETGDKVLIYTNTRKAILYRVSTNKIIEVAPVTIGQTAGAATSGN